VGAGGAFAQPGNPGGAPTIPVVGSGGTLGSGPGLPPPAGTGGAVPGTPIGTGSFCDALGVVRAECQGCHGADRRFGAPMSLVSYADFIAPAITDKGKKVFELMPARLHDALKPMPPSTSPRLTPNELATLDAWLAGGAQPGPDPACGTLPPATNPPPTTPSSSETFTWPADCETHYKLTAAQNGAKHVVPAGKEEHPQISIVPPWPGAAQALAFRPITDNAKVLHHWIMYAADGSFLTGWAPGSENGRVPLPADVGMYLPSSGNLRLDMHYNNLGGTTTEQDASGVEVCVIQTQSKFRANTATVFGGFSALPSIPPNQKVDNVGNCAVSTPKGPVHVLSQSPHMHLLGVNAKLVLTRGGQQTVLHDAPFTFDDQRNYPFSPELMLQTGDKVTTTCTYQNNTSKTVTFGENTGNEMCFNFVVYYPMGGMSCTGARGPTPSL
jgi:hypothetical protein